MFGLIYVSSYFPLFWLYTPLLKNAPNLTALKTSLFVIDDTDPGLECLWYKWKITIILADRSPNPHWGLRIWFLETIWLIASVEKTFKQLTDNFVDISAAEIYLELLQIVEANYPETLHTGYVINGSLYSDPRRYRPTLHNKNYSSCKCRNSTLRACWKRAVT